MRGLRGRYVLSGDDSSPPLVDGAVVLDGTGRVEAVGTYAQLSERCPSLQFETHDAVLMPGLVNCHTHLELSHLRGRVAGGRGFVPWLQALLEARGTPAPPPDPEAIDAGVGELLRSGTVAVGEVSNSLASVEALGTAPLLGTVFHEVYAMRGDTGLVMLAAARQARAAIAQWPTNLQYALSPHTPYTLHPDTLRRIVALDAERSVRGSLHLAEHPAERAFLRDGGGPFAAFLRALDATPMDWEVPGLGPVQYAASLGALGPHMIAVHLADATRDDLQQVARAGAPVVLCPRSNLHIEVRLPPLLDVLSCGLRPGLGTDSLASCPSLDVLAEARALRERFAGVAPRTLIAMLTSYGAEVLGLEDRVGRLAPGLTPGVVAFELEGQVVQDPEAFVLSNHAKTRRVLSRPGGSP